MKFTIVKTPKYLDLSTPTTLRYTQDVLNSEFKSNDSWTEQCTLILISAPKTLFLFDRFEQSLARAFGNEKFKIALNPLMIICYHKSCICKDKPVVKLKHMFDVHHYVKHLLCHNDEVGKSMRLLFGAIAENPFMTHAQLDEIYQSPYSLNPLVLIPDSAISFLEKYGISRQLSTEYICHWKNKFIKSGHIQPSSLTYQQDDALIYSTLHHPNPVRDWSLWSTLSLYCLKLYSSLSSSALSLYRGITTNRIAGSAGDAISCMSNTNHPGPSVTTIQSMLPSLSYESEVFHKTEVLFHLKLLSKLEETIKLSYPGVTRFPVTLGIDEQELNQGTFIHDGYLYGLNKKMNADDIDAIGIINFPSHIAEMNNYIIAVREYHLTDFATVFCSNVYTSLESECLKYEKCSKSLDDIAGLSRKCVFCLQNNLVCEYLRLDTKCKNCEEQNVHCTSLVVFHVLWDMG